MVKKAGYRLVVTTNGTRLNEGVRDLPIDELYVSFNTPTPESYALKRGKGPSFDAYVENLAAFVRIRPPSPIYPDPLRCVVFGNANSRSPSPALCPANSRTPRCFSFQWPFPSGILPATRHRPESAFTPPQKGSAPKLPSPPESLALFGA
jgi:hypothetical protein